MTFTGVWFAGKVKLCSNEICYESFQVFNITAQSADSREISEFDECLDLNVLILRL